jgi:glutaredoxin
LLKKYLVHLVDIAKAAVGAGIGTSIALELIGPPRALHSVTLYSTPNGQFCNAAREFFSVNRITFVEYDVTKDLNRRKEMITKSGQMGYPVIFVGDEMVVGFDEKRLRGMLRMSGA